jgi:hypothetical protein
MTNTAALNAEKKLSNNPHKVSKDESSAAPFLNKSNRVARKNAFI